MGYKHVCFNCRIAKNIGVGSVIKGFHKSNCTKCNQPMALINHAFRPPKKTDLKSWFVAKYLVDNGFPFHHVYQAGRNPYKTNLRDNYIPYPKILQTAKEFIEKHKNQSVKRNQQ